MEGGEGQGLMANGDRGLFLGGDETKLIAVIVTQLWEYTKNHWTVPVHWVNGTVSGILFQYRG